MSEGERNPHTHREIERERERPKDTDIVLTLWCLQFQLDLQLAVATTARLPQQRLLTDPVAMTLSNAVAIKYLSIKCILWLSRNIFCIALRCQAMPCDAMLLHSS